MSKLYELLTDLATNPHKQAAFAQSPTAVMDAAGLTEVERAIVKSGERAKIIAAFADELPVLSIAFREPDPDPSPDPDPTPDSGPDSEPSEGN
ncbi:hypothetical protein [Argonema antarcticum]|uniref:hypothetical protein n=1 Tax=Argonema antarcticum TaxID=2942763 RepID=UPI0020113F53|nr:hypothetical protein [Argonema antarcticum]MCL1472346.1 hypothetical protein [Argonema antarcticum A004/B2]